MSKEKIEITVNGIIFVPKDSMENHKDANNYPYVLVRTYSAGVHCGYMSNRKGKEVTLIDSRRIFYWEGACSLSQIAIDGLSESKNSTKIAMVLPEILLTEAIEIIPMTKTAADSIINFRVWKS